MSFSVQIEGADEALLLISRVGDKAPIVLRRTLNKTLKNTHVFTTKEIGKTFNLPAKRIKKNVKRNFARGQSALTIPNASLTIVGRPIGVEQFGGRQTRKGVTWKERRSGSRQLEDRSFGSKLGWRRLPPGLFWQRVEGDRLPIERLVGPSMPEIMHDQGDELLNKTRNYGKERLRINLLAEVRFEILRQNV